MQEDVSQLLQLSLEDTAQQAQAWPDEGGLLVISMQIRASLERIAEPLQLPEQTLPDEIEEDAEDDGVLPNQQAIAQEMLSRVLIMTGKQSQDLSLYLSLNG